MVDSMKCTVCILPVAVDGTIQTYSISIFHIVLRLNIAAEVKSMKKKADTRKCERHAVFRFQVSFRLRVGFS